MQIATISGTVGKDAELRRTGDGKPVLGFSVGVSNGKDAQGNWRDSTWWDCSLWGKRAEALQGKITKGTKLSLMGRPGAREYNGKAYLQLDINELTFMGGGKPKDDSQGGYSDEPSGGYGGQGGGFDDEIPF